MKAHKKLAALTAFAVLATPFLTSLANAQTFTDVSTNAWYASSVNELTNAGVAFGTDGSHYAPDKAITRGEVAQMLYNALGKPSVSGGSGFSDVAGSPYATAIAYCKQQGIISGYPDGTFKPNATITRQEAAVMIWNVVGNYDQNVKPLPKHFATQIPAKQWGNTQPFPDADTWANFYVNELALNGVIHGYPDGTFKPNNTITRAEMTQILDGVLHKVGYAFGAQTATTASNTLVTNSDGTQSPANVAVPSLYSSDPVFKLASQSEIKNLMSQVKFQVDGQNVTVTVPDTNDPNVEWMITDWSANQTHTQKQTTIKSPNGIAVSLQQPDTVGSGVYLVATYKQVNGKWTLIID